MPVGLLGVLGSVGGALISSSASKSAANAQTKAANDQIALDTRIYDETSANFAPYLSGGTDGWNALRYELGLAERPESYGGFQATPGYEFQRQQGLDAVQSSAAARGNLYSGATMKAVTDYSQGLANQEYNNYLNRLSGVAASGQAAAGNQANAGANFSANAGNSLAAIGNAQAAGAIGSANAINGGITNALSSFGYLMGNQSGGANKGNNANSSFYNPLFGGPGLGNLF